MTASLDMPFDRLLDPDLPAPLMWFVLAWLFAVGACIGSFMNVVIYRLPAGLSLLHPPSRCPDCETPIRATDNVPIFGWLWLRGRCRHCQARISPRYPAVELLVAVVFAGLAWAEPLSRLNLPSSAAELTMGQLWGLYAYHLLLLCSLICAAFIEFDRHALPMRLAIPVLIVGLTAPVNWPNLRPSATVFVSSPALNALVDGGVGALAGAALGYAIGWSSRLSLPERMPFRGATGDNNSAIALAWVGAFLGWQAVVAVATATLVSGVVVVLIGRIVPTFRSAGWTTSIAVWCPVWMLASKCVLR